MTWIALEAAAPINATCFLPGSKSQTNRALALASICDGHSRLTGVLDARDTTLMVDGLRALGTTIQIVTEPDGSLTMDITPANEPPVGDVSIDCGLAGTVMRFLPPIAAQRAGSTYFHGDPRAGERPMIGVTDGLRQLGADVDHDFLPLTVSSSGDLAGGDVVIDSSASSQFISALLLSAARWPQGIRVTHQGESVPSRPHIDMTIAMLAEHGVRVDECGEYSWRVAPGAVRALDRAIEPDLTNAAVFLIAGVLSGGSVRVPRWPQTTTQPGDLIRDVLTSFGATVSYEDGALTAMSGDLRGGVIDLHAASELTCSVAALAAFAEGTTTITGVGHIRGHETDRLAALVDELTSLGVDAHETPDGLHIVGGTTMTPTRPLRSYADHRMAHFAALIGLRVPGVEVEDIDAVSKTMPDFTERWQAMLDGDHS